ncbi:MAG: hypothetical protein WC333_01020 [Dehalococcoidia bacterium]|jgi:hypothetical protein
MPQTDYKRYALLKNPDGTTSMTPFTPLPRNASDKSEIWNSTFNRMDRLSRKYYGNPFYDFLIMLANPEYLNEFDIPDGAQIRIPFPLSKVKADYEAMITAYKNQ